MIWILDRNWNLKYDLDFENAWQSDFVKILTIFPENYAPLSHVKVLKRRQPLSHIKELKRNLAPVKCTRVYARAWMSHAGKLYKADGSHLYRSTEEKIQKILDNETEKR